MKKMKTWQLQNAKSHFSEMVREATLDGPQYISVRNVPTAVIISVEKYKELTQPTSSLVQFMRKSPLRGLDLDFTRDQSLPRDVEDL